MSVDTAGGRDLILFAHQYPPVNSSGVQRAFRFSKYLPECGFRTHVVCSSSEGTLPLPDVNYLPNAWSQQNTPGTHRILAAAIQRVLPHNERLHWVPDAVAAAEKILREHPVAALLSTSPPVSSHIAAMYLKRKYGIPWVADFRDALVGNPFRIRKHGSRAYERWLERKIFTKADLVTTVTDRLISEWCETYPWLRTKAQVVWNGFDPEEQFEPVPLVKRERRILAHVGVIYGQRHPALVLESLERLMGANRLNPESFRVELTGPINENGDTRKLDSFQLLRQKGCLDCGAGKVPREQAMSRIAECDFLFLIDVNQFNVGHAAPAKLFDYVRACRPILSLVPRDSVVERILSQSGIRCTFLYPDDSQPEFDRKVLEFLTQPDTPTEPSDWFWEQFDGRRQAAALAAVLDQLVKRS